MSDFLKVIGTEVIYHKRTERKTKVKNCVNKIELCKSKRKALENKILSALYPCLPLTVNPRALVTSQAVEPSSPLHQLGLTILTISHQPLIPQLRHRSCRVCQTIFIAAFNRYVLNSHLFGRSRSVAVLHSREQTLSMPLSCSTILSAFVPGHYLSLLDKRYKDENIVN